MSDYNPTELTAEDIDAVVKEWEDNIHRPIRMTDCPSCGVELPYMLTDYYTGQCQECFYARKPWCGIAAVEDAYFAVSDEQ